MNSVFLSVSIGGLIKGLNSMKCLGLGNSLTLLSREIPSGDHVTVLNMTISKRIGKGLSVCWKLVPLT